MAKRKSIASMVPVAVQEHINNQRRRLQQGRAALYALEFSAIHDADEVDAGNVAGLVVDVIDDAIEKLDSVVLKAVAKRSEQPAPRKRKK